MVIDTINATLSELVCPLCGKASRRETTMPKPYSSVRSCCWREHFPHSAAIVPQQPHLLSPTSPEMYRFPTAVGKQSCCIRKSRQYCSLYWMSEGLPQHVYSRYIQPWGLTKLRAEAKPPQHSSLRHVWGRCFHLQRAQHRASCLGKRLFTFEFIEELVKWNKII